MNTLNDYGVKQQFLTEAAQYPEYKLGRIISQYKNLYKVITYAGEERASLSGKFCFEVNFLSDYPTVGDYVMLSESGGSAVIHRVLTRISSIERSAVKNKNQTQVIAANVDIVFICMSLNNDYNLRRLERYLSITYNRRATPVIILTKADLCANVTEKLAEIGNVAIGTEVIVTSNKDINSLKQISSYLKQGVTASFIGSSGVGKSTLINLLAGKDFLATNEITKDDKGRHTTTRKDCFLLSEGGIVIDTPGMREIGVDFVDTSKIFADIDSLAQNCRFKDCTHNKEPGCAVRAAAEEGKLDEERLLSYLKLKEESKYDGMNSKQIEMLKIKSMFGSLNEMKNARKYVKDKNK